MSYILDALKKAAEQRSSAPNEVRRLLSPAPVAPESVWRYIGVGAIAAGVLGVILAVWLWAGAARQDATAPATPVASVVPAPPVPGAPAEPARQMPATAMDKPLDAVSPPPRRATADAVSPQPRHPATESRRESSTTNSVPRLSSSADAHAATAAAPRPTTGEDARATTPGEPSNARSTTATRATKAPRTGATAPASTPPTPIVAAVPSAPSTGAPMRSDLGKLKVEVIVYSEQRPLRWAFISGRKYVEGDAIGDGARVEEIQSGGVVIVEDGRRVTLRP